MHHRPDLAAFCDDDGQLSGWWRRVKKEVGRVAGQAAGAVATVKEEIHRVVDQSIRAPADVLRRVGVGGAALNIAEEVERVRMDAHGVGRRVGAVVGPIVASYFTGGVYSAIAAAGAQAASAAAKRKRANALRAQKRLSQAQAAELAQLEAEIAAEQSSIAEQQATINAEQAAKGEPPVDLLAEAKAKNQKGAVLVLGGIGLALLLSRMS